MVQVGDQVEAVVLEVKPKDRRISLGIKQLEADPWTTVADRYSIGSVVEGRVRKLTDFGAFIEIEEGIDGLVHVSDLSWTKRSQASLGGGEERADRAGGDSEYRRSEPAALAGGEAIAARCLGDILPDTSDGRSCARAEFAGRRPLESSWNLLPGVEGLCHKSEIVRAGTARPKHRVR